MANVGTAVFTALGNFQPLVGSAKTASRALDGVSRSAAGVGTALPAGGGASAVGVSTLGTRVAQLHDTLGRTGKTMTMGVTLPVAAGIAVSIKSFSDFETAITSAGQKSGATKEQLAQMGELAKRMGNETKFTTMDAANAMGQLAAAGLDANRTMGVLPSVMLAAQASGEDLSLTAATMSQTMNAFNIKTEEAAHVSDVFTTAANTTALTMQDLADGIANAGEVGPRYGQSLEAVTAALGRMRDLGVPAAEAGTAIRQSLTSLAAPTAQSAALIKGLGLQTRDAHGNMLQFPDLVRNTAAALSKGNPAWKEYQTVLGKSGKGLKDWAAEHGMTLVQARRLQAAVEKGQGAFKDYALATMFGVEGAKAFSLSMAEGKPVILDAKKDAAALNQLQKDLAVTMGDKAAKAWIAARTENGKFTASGADTVQVLTAINKSAKGTAKEFSDVRAKTQEAKLDQMFGQMKNAAIEFGAAIAPVVKDVAKWIGELAQKVGDWVKRNPDMAKTVGIILAIAAAVGPLLLAFSKVISMISLVSKAFLLLGANPWAIIIAATIALVYLIITNWDKIKKFLSDVWNWISSTASKIWGTVWKAITDFVSHIAADIGRFFEGVKKVWSDGWNWVKNAAATVWNAIVSFLTTVWNGIVAAVKWYVGLYVSIFTGAWNLIKSVATTVWNAIKGFLTGLWDGITSLIKRVVDGWKNILSTAWTAIKKTASDVWNGIKSTMSTVWTWIRDNVISRFSSAIGGLGTAFGKARDAIGTAWKKIKELAAKPIEFVVNTVIIDGLIGGFNRLMDLLHLGGLKISPPKKLYLNWGAAQGGVMPGYTPGRDVHHFFSPTAGSLHLSGGESVMRPEWTKAVGGASTVAFMNREAKAGRNPMDWIGHGKRNFADGGILGWLGSVGSNVANWGASAWDVATHPLRLLEGLVSGVVDRFASNQFVQVGVGLVSSSFGKVAEKIGAIASQAMSSFWNPQSIYQGPSGTTTWPVGRAPITAYYGQYPSGGQHTGIDFGVPTGTPVRAFRPGVVSAAGWDYSGYGNAVRIAHNHGYNTIYAHNRNLVARVGQSVSSGQVVSYSDNTGNSRGPHLHFGVKHYGQWVNPWPFLQGQAFSGGGVLMDNGGLIKPGTTLVHNRTGMDEVVTPMSVLRASERARLRGNPNAAFLRATVGATRLAGRGGDSTVNIVTHVYNPVAERASDSVNRRLTRTAQLGLINGRRSGTED